MPSYSNFHKLMRNMLLLVLITGLISCGEDDGGDPNGGTLTVDAGPDQTVELGDEVTLAGSGTADLLYFWEFTTVPSSVGFALVDDPADPNSTFTPTEAGTYVLQLTGENANGDTENDEMTLTVETGDVPEEIGGTISTDRTLVNRFEDPDLPDYIASSMVSVQAVLTIDPEVKIIFAEDQGLEVTTGGSIIAVGSGTEPITFIGKDEVKGYWMGINILSNNPANTLEYVEVRYGGSSGFDGANVKANVTLKDAGRLKMAHCTLSEGGGAGVALRSLTSTLVDFTSNTITQNEVPATVLFTHFHYFDGQSDYSGNTDDYIDSETTSHDTSEDVTWAALNVPYRLPANIAGIQSDVVIEEGAEFIGQENSGLQIMDGGSLNAVGTANSKIVFRGEQDVKGKWIGLSFHSNTIANELTYVEIYNGGQKGFDGANLKANIMVDDAGRLKMTNALSTKSAGYGLYTRDLESTLDDFANNVLTDNDAPVMTRYSHYHYFDAASDYSGNTHDYIDSYWGNKESTQTWTWEALNVPYRLAPNVEDIYSNVTILAGAEFIGQPNGGFQIQTGGSMKANGTSVNPIVFRGEQDVTGYWKGLRFLSNMPDNSFVYTTVSNGGEEGFDGANRKANVEVGGASAQFSANNCTFSKSGDAGVRVQSGGAFSDTNNTYSGNLGVNVDS
ncbi:PKD domain-containing protein [Reichenbachiella sp. MSK19-1]|uniref:PKD domain-containing protein n=1 Tax=Reichenbachiella sp. MSK19-1 TaxID=1897631 RepID=UPI000E6C033D|nr:PKD domain-containing protein [Reichenbachiella sp. MSK19-1]RJE70459.1 hypothetical protein BGP76_10230 [Reichenbachiella sp. MSK19-1]